MEEPPSILSRGKRYFAVPSLTVRVQPKIPRACGKLTPNSNCKGGDMRRDTSGSFRRQIPALTARREPGDLKEKHGNEYHLL